MPLLRTRRSLRSNQKPARLPTASKKGRELKNLCEQTFVRTPQKRAKQLRKEQSEGFSFVQPISCAKFEQQGDRTDFARSPIVSDIYETIFLQAGSQLV